MAPSTRSNATALLLISLSAVSATATCTQKLTDPSGAICGTRGSVRAFDYYLKDLFDPVSVTTEGCANECANTRGCASFDVSVGSFCELQRGTQSQMGMAPEEASFYQGYDLSCFTCTDSASSTSSSASSTISSTSSTLISSTSSAEPTSSSSFSSSSAEQSSSSSSLISSSSTDAASSSSVFSAEATSLSSSSSSAEPSSSSSSADQTSSSQTASSTATSSSTTSSLTAPSSIAVPVCGIKGYAPADSNTFYNNNGSFTQAQCQVQCISFNAQSYGTGSGLCACYSMRAEQIVDPVDASPYTFSDIACAQSTASSTSSVESATATSSSVSTSSEVSSSSVSSSTESSDSSSTLPTETPNSSLVPISTGSLSFSVSVPLPTSSSSLSASTDVSSSFQTSTGSSDVSSSSSLSTETPNSSLIPVSSGSRSISVPLPTLIASTSSPATVSGASSSKSCSSVIPTPTKTSITQASVSGSSSSTSCTSSTQVPQITPPSSISKSSAILTTSTVYATSVYTITSCAPSVTNCPLGSVTTKTIAISTTICPVAASETKNSASGPASSPIPTSIVTPLTTSTVYAASVYTITHCAPGAANCGIGYVSTKIVPLYTTVCPVTQASETPVASASSVNGVPSNPASDVPGLPISHVTSYSTATIYKTHTPVVPKPSADASSVVIPKPSSPAPGPVYSTMTVQPIPSSPVEGTPNSSLVPFTSTPVSVIPTYPTAASIPGTSNGTVTTVKGPVGTGSLVLSVTGVPSAVPTLLTANAGSVVGVKAWGMGFMAVVGAVMVL